MPTSSSVEPMSAGEPAEVVSTRIFSAPRSAVFAAFRDPAQLTQWWGPQGFTSTFEIFDLRPGGIWRFVMHGPDGANYPNENHFVDVAAPVRIVYEHRQSGHNFRMTMHFVEVGEKTELTWRMAFESRADFSKLKTFISDANEQNFDRLATHLARPRVPSPL